MVGERILHYQVEELVGSGGMGVVYRASDVRLGRPVALKILKSELTTDTDRRKRFFQEARTASSVTHPAIAQVYDVGEEDGVVYMAMEFVAGKTVRELVRSRDLDLLGALEIGIQVADGLQRAHSEGLVHRDIKSDNIMVTPDGHTKILDFGLAKLLAAPSTDTSGDAISEVETMAQTQIGTVMGTVAYMSPEQARGRAVDHRSDLFSLGVVLYEMVTSELPFKGDSPLDTMHAVAFEEIQPVTIVRRNLPSALQQVISKCLRKRPEDRYDQASDLSNDLKSLKREIESGVQSTIAVRPGLRTRLVEWLRDSLPTGWAGIAGVAVVVAAVAWLLMQRFDIATLIVLLLIGLPTYRFVRNRRRRMLKRFTNRISRYPEVHMIAIQQDRITVVAYSARGALYQEVNALVDRINHKQFYGESVSAAVRDDLNTEELRRLLRDPGLVFVRDELVAKLQEAAAGGGQATVSGPGEGR